MFALDIFANGTIKQLLPVNSVLEYNNYYAQDNNGNPYTHLPQGMLYTTMPLERLYCHCAALCHAF